MAATLFETFPSLRLMSFTPYNIFIDELDNVDYRHEAARLKSFKNWIVPYMEPEKLAAAGFYFTGEADIVKCFECGQEIYKWLEGDDPMVDHRRESPRCRFVRHIPCGNVPIDADPSTIPPPEGEDVCGLYDRDCNSPYKSYCDPFLNLQFANKEAKYPEFESNEARLSTFEFWPKLMRPIKEDLSEAGFYYTGTEDQVLCFHCGVGVKHWKPDDDPWVEHAFWRPNCNYLLTVKGEEYVKQIRNPFPNDMASYVAKVEQLVVAESNEITDDDSHPDQNSQNSQTSHDSGAETMSSTNSSVKGSIENLLDAEAGCSKPIEDARICKICFNAEISKVFLPCCHFIACASCAKCIKKCPICRNLVADIMQVFFS